MASWSQDRPRCERHPRRRPRSQRSHAVFGRADHCGCSARSPRCASRAIALPVTTLWSRPCCGVTTKFEPSVLSPRDNLLWGSALGPRILPCIRGRRRQQHLGLRLSMRPLTSRGSTVAARADHHHQRTDRESKGVVFSHAAVCRRRMHDAGVAPAGLSPRCFARCSSSPLTFSGMVTVLYTLTMAASFHRGPSSDGEHRALRRSRNTVSRHFRPSGSALRLWPIGPVRPPTSAPVNSSCARRSAVAGRPAT